MRYTKTYLMVDNISERSAIAGLHIMAASAVAILVFIAFDIVFTANPQYEHPQEPAPTMVEKPDGIKHYGKMVIQGSTREFDRLGPVVEQHKRQRWQHDPTEPTPDQVPFQGAARLRRLTI